MIGARAKRVDIDNVPVLLEVRNESLRVYGLAKAERDESRDQHTLHRAGRIGRRLVDDDAALFSLAEPVPDCGRSKIAVRWKSQAVGAGLEVCGTGQASEFPLQGL